ncbi:MAG: TonB-dependent receptor [Vulcanimicrobiota bacterium]
MNRSSLRWALALLAACLQIFILSHPTLAAEDRGDLVVTVLSEETEEPVEGAEVRVMNRAKNRVLYRATTNAEGIARFTNLSIGEVFVEASKEGIGLDRSLLTITAGSDNTFEAYLMPFDEDTTAIQVEGDLLLVNSTSPTEGATTRRDSDFMKRQIAGGNDLQGVLATIPGVQSNSLGQVHVRGEHKALSLTLDGVDLPIATESSVTQPIDPEFIDTAEVATGMYDAAQGGQQGAVVNAVTPGEGDDPFVRFDAKVGDYGQTDLILKAGGSNEANDVNYFVGVRRRTSDLYLESPHPNTQDLNNHGQLVSLMLKLNKKTDLSRFGLTLSHQSADYGVPQTPQNFAAGVRQNQEDSNTLALLSWNQELTENDDLLFGLAFQRSRQKTHNNGAFTPFTAVPVALQEELAEEGFPLDPENPGSPYLPSTDLTITQLKPSLDYTHRFRENHRLKAGLSANFINSNQRISITDPGGGGGLPNPLGLPGTPVAFQAALERDAFVGGLYLSHTYPLTEKLIVNYGLRADTYDDGLGLSTGQISPRVNLSFAPTDEQAFRLSYNRLFQPPPLELDVSGGTQILPQRTDAYELSYENQFAKNWVGKIALVRKDFKDQIDVGLLIPNSNIPVFAPVNFARAYYQGIELSVSSHNETGWNGFATATIGEAKPTEPGLFVSHFPRYNDHDQRIQATAGVSHTWKNGLSAGVDVLYGSGYPQEALPLYNSIGIAPFGLSGDRQSRFITNLNIQYFPEEKEGGTLGAGLQVFNLFDDRSLLNLFSEFSGTRFVTGRRFLLNLNARF